MTDDTWSEHYAAPRRAGKRAAVIEMCAMQELRCTRWDVVGGTPDTERDIRRQAREHAAHISQLLDGPTETP